MAKILSLRVLDSRTLKLTIWSLHGYTMKRRSSWQSRVYRYCQWVDSLLSHCWEYKNRQFPFRARSVEKQIMVLPGTGMCFCTNCDRQFTLQLIKNTPGCYQKTAVIDISNKQSAIIVTIFSAWKILRKRHHCWRNKTEVRNANPWQNRFPCLERKKSYQEHVQTCIKTSHS